MSELGGVLINLAAFERSLGTAGGRFRNIFVFGYPIYFRNPVDFGKSSEVNEAGGRVWVWAGWGTPPPLTQVPRFWLLAFGFEVLAFGFGGLAFGLELGLNPCLLYMFPSWEQNPRFLDFAFCYVLTDNNLDGFLSVIACIQEPR